MPGEICKPKPRYYGNPATEQSNLAAARESGAAAIATEVLDYVSATGKLLLNCNFAHPTDDTKMAGITDTRIEVAPEPNEGRISETFNSCYSEETVATPSGGTRPITVPCYEWQDGDFSMDIMGAGSDSLYQTLDFDLFRYFGEGVIFAEMEGE